MDMLLGRQAGKQIINREIDGRAGRWAGRWAGRQARKWAGRQTGSWMGLQIIKVIDGYADRWKTYIIRQAEKQTDG